MTRLILTLRLFALADQHHMPPPAEPPTQCVMDPDGPRPSPVPDPDDPDPDDERCVRRVPTRP